MSVRVGVSSYSYWHFREPKVPLEFVLEHAQKSGADGVEFLHRQMESEETGYLNGLKRRAFSLGMPLMGLSIHQDFVSPDPEIRAAQVAHTIRCLELAHHLGIPCLRLNSGRWKTIASFDELMERRGDEPPLPGYTEDDAFSWCIDSIEKCLPTAEKCGVLLALENHWGLTRLPSGVIRILDAIDSPWLSGLLDTGNFRENLYENIEAMAARASFVQAKTYPGGGEWYTLDIDYDRVATILKNARYRGWVSLEMEGRTPAESAVPESIALLKRAFASAGL